jgi:hypothetical protein
LGTLHPSIGPKWNSDKLMLNQRLAGRPGRFWGSAGSSPPHGYRNFVRPINGMSAASSCRRQDSFAEAD